MRRHDGRDLRLDGGPEGLQLNVAQPLDRMLDDRQLLVRIDRRIAVARKVLAAGRDAFGLESPDDGRAECDEDERQLRRVHRVGTELVSVS